VNIQDEWGIWLHLENTKTGVYTTILVPCLSSVAIEMI